MYAANSLQRILNGDIVFASLITMEPFLHPYYSQIHSLIAHKLLLCEAIFGFVCF